MMYKLPQLKFTTDGLSGFLTPEAINFHYHKHHQAYLDKTNALVSENRELQGFAIEDLLRQASRLSEPLRTSLVNQGGGYYNHNLYWSFLTSDLNQQPSGKLLESLESKYGSFEAFQQQFTDLALAVFGSGWVWLMPDLEIVSTMGQENPIMKGAALPILGVDVWEHAYYLDYQNRRADYIKQWWTAVDWEQISKNFSN